MHGADAAPREPPADDPFQIGPPSVRRSGRPEGAARTGVGGEEGIADIGTDLVAFGTDGGAEPGHQLRGEGAGRAYPRFDDARRDSPPAGVQGGDPPDDLDPRERMRWRLDTPQGRTRYARRKAVVEPVNGQIKHARGFRQFSLRGVGGVDAEWVMVSLCHNVLKLFGHQGTGPCPA